MMELKEDSLGQAASLRFNPAASILRSDLHLQAGECVQANGSPGTQGGATDMLACDSPECAKSGMLKLTGSRHSQLQGREPRVCSPAPTPPTPPSLRSNSFVQKSQPVKCSL